MPKTEAMTLREKPSIWKDVTSYKRGDSERNPTSWTASFGAVLITVTSAHIYNRGAWTMHARPWFDTHDMEMPADEFTAEQAQSAALKKVSAVLDRARAALTAALGDAK